MKSKILAIASLGMLSLGLYTGHLAAALVLAPAPGWVKTEPEKPTCREVIPGHFPARKMLPAGASEHSRSSGTRQEARYCSSP